MFYCFNSCELWREQAPISSRLNAVDLYLVVCVFFVFSKETLELARQLSDLSLLRCSDGVRRHPAPPQEEAAAQEDNWRGPQVCLSSGGCWSCWSWWSSRGWQWRPQPVSSTTREEKGWWPGSVCQLSVKHELLCLYQSCHLLSYYLLAATHNFIYFLTRSWRRRTMVWPGCCLPTLRTSVRMKERREVSWWSLSPGSNRSLSDNFNI